MKKLITFICIMLFAMFSINTTSYAASVDPEFHEGNDSNPNDYQPPEGCVHFEIPNSGTPGTYTVTFDATGAYDPMGPFSFTVVVGTAPGEDFTKVLSWSSNFPIDAVIVKGGNGFNLYPYGTSVRSDTNLVSPNNASGHPADVSHVSIVICPEDFPPEPPTPTPSPTPTPTSTPTPTPTATPTPTVTPTPTPCPPCPPCPPTFFCCIGIFIVFVILIIVAFLLGFLWGGFDPCCRKHRHHKKHRPCDDCNDCDDHDDPCGHKDRKNGPPTPTRKDFF